MENDPAFQLAEDDNVQPTLLAASEHDIPTLRRLLRGATSSAANVRDSDTGFTPLHSAIHACIPGTGEQAPWSTPSGESNGDSHALNGTSTQLDQASETVRYLLQHGAIWNQLDNQNETPGCVALRLGLKQLYEIMVDAGVRAEMLLNRLDGYEPLNDVDSENESGGEDGATTTEKLGDDTQNAQGSADSDQVEEPKAAAPAEEESGQEYLQSNLTFAPDRLVDSERNGVMMAWERDIMARSADDLLPSEGLRVLNIGHGMGIIDGIFQAKKPTEHHIVEAHLEVQDHMRKDGWYRKPGVTVHEGKWQDIVPKLIEKSQVFDAIYFDTFGEDYSALRKFFDEFVIGLLADGGRFSFFNGLGADRQICYDVYAKVVEMDLLECGFDVDWSVVKVDNLLSDETWEGLKRPYWVLSEYKLPLVTVLG